MPTLTVTTYSSGDVVTDTWQENYPNYDDAIIERDSVIEDTRNNWLIDTENTFTQQGWERVTLVFFNQSSMTVELYW